MFEGSWLLTTKRELHDGIRLLHGNLDENRRAINAHLEVLQDKLKNHHSNLGTLGSKEALAERKRVCRILGLLTEEDENLVKGLTEPLPVVRVENNCGEEEREAKGQDLFLTPRTPSYFPRLNDVDQYWPQSPCSITTSPAPDATLVPSSALSPAKAALANVNHLIVSESFFDPVPRRHAKIVSSAKLWPGEESRIRSSTTLVLAKSEADQATLKLSLRSFSLNILR